MDHHRQRLFRGRILERQTHEKAIAPHEICHSDEAASCTPNLLRERRPPRRPRHCGALDALSLASRGAGVLSGTCRLLQRLWRPNVSETKSLA
eukprot:scaffold1230_cov239-Pinguiococcus_pyrenoidosus.AAC.2